jgi:hypothetical protein
MLSLLTWDRVGPLGESRGPSVGKGRECDVESRRLQGCSPCLCQLRTDGLASTSKYWMYWSHAGDMSLVNRCSLLLPNAWLSPLLQWFWGGEILDRDLWIGQPTCWGCSQEFLFLRSSDSIQYYWWLVKGCHVWGLPAESVRVAYMDWHGKHMCYVYRVSPVGCTSIWIVVTLGYE